MSATQVNFLKKHVDPEKLKPKLKAQMNGGQTNNATFNLATFSSSDTAFESLANKNNNIL